MILKIFKREVIICRKEVKDTGLSFTITFLIMKKSKKLKEEKMEIDMIIQDEYGYKIKNWNKYQNLQEKGVKQIKESTEKSKNVETEREKK